MAAGKKTSSLREFERICRRVEEKSASYDRYNFSSRYNDFLKAFFDLAQEFDSLDDFYRICVAVPLKMTGFASRLYLINDSSSRLELVCDSRSGVLKPPEPAREPIHLSSIPYETSYSYLIPIYAKVPVGSSEDVLDVNGGNGHRQTSLWGDSGGAGGYSRILGMYEVEPLTRMDESDRFFFQKYTNRIGFNLHNRLIALQNIDHLKFINTLVMDIEHNVIVPNMYFRHLFNQLRKRIGELDDLKDEGRRLACDGTGNKAVDEEACERWLAHCDRVKRDFLACQQELVKHHANISLFLESLFRREHFERGHLVLRPRRCFVEKEIIGPQLEHYASRLKAARVTVEKPRNMLEEEFQVLVDVGLLAQVYANLFSNAAKYTREVVNHQGHPRKAMAYGRELVDDFPEPGKKGIKFNVFTTGPHLPEDEQNRLFLDGMRGRDSKGIPGTGHGLSFIRHVIELHGGTVGYEPTPEGNNFYFILPVPSTIPPTDMVDAVR